VLDRVAQRTLRESQAGVDHIIARAPPTPATPAVEHERREVSMPDGYTLAEHFGIMRHASISQPPSQPPDSEPTPIPSWLQPEIGIESILELPLRERDQVFAVLRIAPSADSQAINESLTRLGARIEGASGEHLRVLAAPKRTLLETIAEIPGVLGIGALPPEAKFSANFAAKMRSALPSTVTPVFITLMGDDAGGDAKRALTALGVTVGAYDADVRSYTANLPARAFYEVTAADFVMHIEPVALVTATHDSSVPIMGADGLRRYEYAGETFAGLTGRGIAVGVLDTGLNLSHADITHGRESICGASFVRGEHWDLWIDLDGHGTHVFGTIAGAGRIDPLRAGMAPNLSHLRFAKVLNRVGFGSNDGIRRGMDYLSRPSACPGRETHIVKPSIINMSLSGSTNESTGRALDERKLDAMVYGRGQLYVVSQSNEGVRGFSDLGTAKNSLAVGAVRDSGVIADFSSHGPTADGRIAPKVVGTGVDIWSVQGSMSRDGYARQSGTSQASPAVAGVAALLLEADGGLREKPALIRARLMAGAIRPEAYLMSHEQFPRNNSQGPGAMQNQYGMGLVSARSTVASLNSADGWQVGSAESLPTASRYDYIDVRVPEGASRLDVVLTWDEGPADTFTNSVLNDLDLWLDQGADCGDGACGEHVSRSRVDNVEWVIVPAPTPGTHRIKIVPQRVYGEPVRAAVAWKIIQGESTPQLRVSAEQITSQIDADQLTLRINVETSSYLAAGTTMHFSCPDTSTDGCTRLLVAMRDAKVRIIRQDGLVRVARLDGLLRFYEQDGFVRGGGGRHYFSLGEVAPKAPRKVEIQLNRSALLADTPLHITASSWNARSATRTIMFDGAGSTIAPVPPANDDFGAATRIAGDTGEIPVDFSMASREPGEPDVYGNTRSVWHAWRAPASGLYRFRLTDEGSSQRISPRFDIYTGETIANITSVATKSGEITFIADAGTNYFIRASTDMSAIPEMVMTWKAADVRPANDNFADAAKISGETGSTTGSNEGATLERGEFWNGPAASTWHTWTAPTTGEWFFQLQEEHLDLMLFSGTSVDSMRLLSTPSLDSYASLFADEGATYRIAVATPSADSVGTSYTLTWRKISPTSTTISGPPDQFADAGTIEGAHGSLFSPYADHMSIEPHEPRETGIGSLWWRWKAPESGRFTFFIDGVDAIKLSIWAGIRLSDLVLKTSGHAGTRMVLDADADQTYYLAIGRSMGSINIPLVTLGDPSELRWGATPINDERTNASLITGSDGTVLVDLRRATEAFDEPRDDIGRESAWWQWSAPTSGWHTFSVEGHPNWAVLTIYPAATVGGGEQRPVASSERSFLANGRVETSILAHAGEQYQIRVARRPDASQETPANLHWQATSAPAFLRHRHAIDSKAEAPSLVAGGNRWGPSLAMHPDGSRMFGTVGGQLFALDRDQSSGKLSNPRSITSNVVSADPSAPFDRSALAESRLWWSRVHNRLFAFGASQSNAFMPRATSNAAWSRNLVKMNERGQHIDKRRAFAATSDDTFLYFSQVFDLGIYIYRLDSASSMTIVDRVRTIDLDARAIHEVTQMLVTPDDAYLMAASENGLLIFAIDPENGRLTLVKEIAVGGSQQNSSLAGFEALRGIVLFDDEDLLFVTGSHAPQTAVFDLSAGYAEPSHLHSLTAFSSAAKNVLTSFQPPSTDTFRDCGRAYAHARLMAVDVICEQGYFVAHLHAMDASGDTLDVADYGVSPAEDRFAGIVPEHDYLLHAVQSPAGGHLYRVSPDGLDGEIHQVQRASAMTADTPRNHAPSIHRRLENQTATVGAAFRYQIPPDTFADADGDALNLSVSGNPDWLDFDAAAHMLSGTPSTSHVTLAPEVITVTATDPQDASASLRFGLEVVEQ